MQNFVNGVLDIRGRVVGNAQFDARRQLFLNCRQRIAHALDYVKRIRGGQDPNAHEGCSLSVEPYIRIVILCAELNVCDFAHADNDAVLLLNNHLAEVIRVPQIGIGNQIDRHGRSLGRSQSREIIIFRQCIAHVGRGHVTRRHLVRLQPQPHRKGAITENVGTLYAADRAKLRLHHTGEIVTDLVFIKLGRGEPDVHRRKLRVGGFQIDNRRFGLRRQVISNLCNFRLNLGQRGVGIVVELEMDIDRAQPLIAG